MAIITTDIQQLYNRTFGTNPKVPPVAEAPDYPDGGGTIKPLPRKQQPVSLFGNTLSTDWLGVEVWLPVVFRELPNDVFPNGTLMLPHAVVRINSTKTIVKTPMVERGGAVRELYSVDDYKITIKGFLIDPNKMWPEAQLMQLKALFEYNNSVVLDNALTNLFVATKRVAIESFDLPEVEGGRKHVRPFTLQCESDQILTLEYV